MWGLYLTQYKLKIGRTNLQDLIVDFDDFTEYQDDIFSIKKFDFIPYVQDWGVIYLQYEVDFDKHLIFRENYHILDLLGDIGGIQAILMSFFQFVLFFLNYRYFD